MDFDDIPDYMPGTEHVVDCAEGVKGVLRIPPLVGPDGKPSCVVIIPPGNPARHLGSAHAGHALFVALENACIAENLATIRFDYKGIGMSIEGGEDISNWKVPANMAMFRLDSWAVYKWAKSNVCDTVEIAGFSMSTGFALDAALRKVTNLYVALSVAPLVYKWISSDPAEQKQAKEGMVINKEIEVPTFFAIGSKDPMSPIEEMRPLIDERADKGAGVTLEILEDADHSFVGYEDKVAEMTARWIKSQVELATERAAAE